MTHTRDPRVVKIAEKLFEAMPYGFEHMKVGPGAADYHAALIAVNTLDEQAEYEYSILWTHIETGEEVPELCIEWATQEKAEAALKKYNETVSEAEKNGGKGYYTGSVVKRRKAGRIEDV